MVILPIILERSILKAERQRLAGLPMGLCVADQSIIEEPALPSLNRRAIIIQSVRDIDARIR